MGERLKNKVAIVTGAGSSGPGWGNGKATAVLFAREGAKVFAVDINQEAVEETRQIISDEGAGVTVQQTDVTRAEQVEAMVDLCIETYGRVDILHNNVGIVEVGGPVEASEESWDRVVAVNLKSMFLTCKFVLPHMEEQGGGAIVNISSIAGIRYLGVPYVSYSATKGAVLQLTQSIALQYAEKNIRANSILPGLMNTPMIIEPLKDVYAEGDIEKMLDIRNNQVPMKRMGDAWDVAHAALFLASDEAKYITGAQLVVDGGLTCKS
ncbi:MAG: SDR family NAD(P)-dependent oxidoreductase [Planctomycetota bacterium]|jgi:NAD(P)-dependent dehydrogenase (short-subunit alcohol dehydrogenase family)|nr:SDR family NAD(P)-dependent oxidoreductase [Planctomycetota bacterium]